MKDDNVEVNSYKAWLLAARPKTLTGAAVPVMMGIACAVDSFGCEVRWVPAVLCVLFAFIMQVDANFVNDYFDFMKGADDEQRLGPKRACSQGWVPAGAMRMALVVTTAVACLVGLPLVYYGGWEMIMVGMACVVFCFLYTISLSYMGLGDVLVLVFFGIVPVCLTCWLVSPASPLFSIPLHVVVLSVACGLAIDTLLVVNNYRDIDNDRRTGKMTLIVRIGARGGLWLYLLLGVVACVLTVAVIACRNSWWALLVLLYLPFHVATAAEMRRIGRGAELNRVLGKTARNMFLYGLLSSAALLV